MIFKNKKYIILIYFFKKKTLLTTLPCMVCRASYPYGDGIKLGKGLNN
jgi:hypothetical protein